jgi:hypothetical protein
MSRAKYISYKFATILFIDYTGTTPEEILTIFDEVKTILKQQESERSVLILSDITNAKIDFSLIEPYKDFLRHNHFYVKAAAIYGLPKVYTVVMNGLLRATGRTVPLFSTKEESLEWLVKQR